MEYTKYVEQNAARKSHIIVAKMHNHKKDNKLNQWWMIDDLFKTCLKEYKHHNYVGVYLSWH